MRANAPSHSQELIAKVRKVEDQMNQGKDYAAAWEATRATGAIYSREQIANATRAEAAMNEGQDYVSAREAAQRAQPTKVQASTVGATLTIK